MYKTLRLILGDQLNHRHSWFKQKHKDVLYVIMEMRQETDYVTHHIQKVVGYFAAMRNFAFELQELGHSVKYIKLDDPDNRHLLVDNLLMLIQEHQIKRFEYQLPDDFRLDQRMALFCENLGLPYKAYSSEHFFNRRSELSQYFNPGLQTNFDTFYKNMRLKTSIFLDDGGMPIGGKWMYGPLKDNKLPSDNCPVPPKTFSCCFVGIHEQVIESGVKTIGHIDADNFTWPISRRESLQMLDYFVENYLPYFGSDKEASRKIASGSVHHSRLSFSLNLKLISPREVLTKAIDHWRKNQDLIGVDQIEHFVRQVLGWREFMRGVYWTNMPQYRELNYLNHQNKLPKFFWTGNTKMNCLQVAIKQSLRSSYAQHNQRLWILGNFMALAGIDPKEVDTWFLGMYMDANEWVQTTNARGMSQFADGGIVGQMPRVSKAQTIDKVGQHCGSCHYIKDKSVGDKACPFNSLHYRFFKTHSNKLHNNKHLAATYDKHSAIPVQEQQQLLDRANSYLQNIDNL